MAFLLAAGLFPIAALGENGAPAAEGNDAPGYVIAKPVDPEALEDEPVVSQMGDVYLLDYGSAREAAKAVGELEAECEFAEVDAAVCAADGELDDHVVEYAQGEDPFTLASRESADAGAGLADAETENVEPNSADVDTDGAENSPEAAEGDDAEGVETVVRLGDEEIIEDGEGENAGIGEDASGGAQAEVEPIIDEISEDDEREAIGDGEAPRILALVDSGAPESRNVVAASSVIDDDPSDSAGHAALVLDAALSQAPDARVVSVKALDENGRGTVSSVYAGIVTAVDEGADIVNLSLYAKECESSAAISDAVRLAEEAGAVVVAAAGNEGEDACGYVPAGTDGVVTVGSCDEGGARREGSNYGDAVDAYAVSEKTSIAAGLASGWLYANSPLDTPASDLQEQTGRGLFYDKASEPGSDEGAPDDPGGEEGAPDNPGGEAVAGEQESTEGGVAQEPQEAAGEFEAAGMKTTFQETELRSDKDRTKSAVTAAGITWKKKIAYYNIDAYSSTVPGMVRETKDVIQVHKEKDDLQPGITVPNNKSADKAEWTVKGSFTVTWKNAAVDAEGNVLDFSMTGSNIRLKHNHANAKKPSRIIIMGNNPDWDPPLLGAKAYFDRKGVSAYPGAVGVSVTYTCKFTYHDAKKNGKPQGSFLMSVMDLDQPDKTLGWGSKWGEFGKTLYVEQIELVSGFSGKAFVEPGTSLYKYSDKASGIIRASSGDDYPERYRTGTVVPTSGSTFTFRWSGSGCGTGLLEEWQGVTIKDRNTAGTDKDQGIVKKTVDNYGANDTGGVPAHARTKTTWRSTTMAWKMPATYAISAKPGYRVSKVELKYAGKNHVLTGKDGQPAKTIAFGGSAYPTVRDYEIVVTTAKVADATPSLTAKKVLSLPSGFSRSLAAGEFSFRLYTDAACKKAAKNARGAAITAKNAANGNIEFTGLPAIVYRDTAEYPYTVTLYAKEDKGSAAGMTYDTTVKELTYRVSYAKGKLTCTDVTAGKAAAAFTNSYAPKGGVKVKKVDAANNAPLEGAVFGIYRGSFTTRDAAQASGKPVAKITSGSGGIAQTAARALDMPGTYTVVEESAPEGYLIDGQGVKTFSLASTDADGTVKDLTGSAFADKAVGCGATIEATKTVSGKALSAGEYEFELRRLAPSNPMPDGAHGDAVYAKNDAKGHVAFPYLELGNETLGKTYRYRLSEVAGSDPQTTYDTTAWIVTVEVGYGPGGAQARVSYAKEQ